MYTETCGNPADAHTFIIETWNIQAQRWVNVRVYADSRLRASKVLSENGYDAKRIGDFQQVR